MLEIVQAKDFKKYSNLIGELGIGDELISIAEALDKNEVIGFGIYHYGDGKVIIDYVDSKGDLYLYDGIVRSILFLAMTNKVNIAFFNISDTKMLMDLSFVKGDNKYLENITEFMDKCKNCRNQS